MKSLLLTVMLMSLLVPCTISLLSDECMQSILCKSVPWCMPIFCKMGDKQRAKEKKKLNPYSRADLLAHFKGFRTNQESIVKKQENIVKQMKRQMKELKGIEKGAAELTKQ